jgi:hypothetical protein
VRTLKLWLYNPRVGRILALVVLALALVLPDVMSAQDVNDKEAAGCFVGDAGWVCPDTSDSIFYSWWNSLSADEQVHALYLLGLNVLLIATMIM